MYYSFDLRSRVKSLNNSQIILKHLAYVKSRNIRICKQLLAIVPTSKETFENNIIFRYIMEIKGLLISS